MAKRDYYDVLGVSKNATQDEIKKSFRKLSLQWHPDRQAGKSDKEKEEATKKFQEVAEAYEVLSDKDKRAHYDQFGFDGPSMSQGGFGGGGFSMADFMKRHGGMFSSFFGGGSPFGDDDDAFGFGGFSSSRSNEAPDPTKPEDGRDVRLKINLPFKDAVFGKVHEFDIDLNEPCSKCHGSGVKDGAKPQKCPHCKGTGMFVERIQHGFMTSIQQGPCPHCNATGYIFDKCDACNGQKRVQKNKHVSVRIPAGIEAGQKLRVKGFGECGTCGGQNGDLYLYINSIEKSDIFERMGNNLKLNWPISPIVATLGGKVEVLTPYGYEKVNVPAGTASGDVIVLKDKGIKTKDATGNLMIVVIVEPIVNLTKEQKNLLMQLQKQLSSNNFKKEKLMRQKADEFLKD